MWLVTISSHWYAVCRHIQKWQSNTNYIALQHHFALWICLFAFSHFHSLSSEPVEWIYKPNLPAPRTRLCFFSIGKLPSKSILSCCLVHLFTSYIIYKQALSPSIHQNGNHRCRYRYSSLELGERLSVYSCSRPWPSSQVPGLGPRLLHVSYKHYNTQHTTKPGLTQVSCWIGTMHFALSRSRLSFRALITLKLCSPSSTVMAWAIFLVFIRSIATMRSLARIFASRLMCLASPA